MKNGTHIRCLLAREAAQLSQTEAARRLNRSVRSIQRLEKHDREDVSIFQQLGDIYECSPIWLEYGLGPMQKDSRLAGIASTWSRLSERQRDMFWKLLIQILESNQHAKTSDRILYDYIGFFL